MKQHSVRGRQGSSQWLSRIARAAFPHTFSKARATDSVEQYFREINLISGNEGQFKRVRDFRTAAEQGYDRVSIAFAAVNYILNAALSIKFVTMETKNGADQPVWNHPVSKLFDIPNPGQSQSAFKNQLLGDFTLGGECFIKLNKPTSGPNAKYVARDMQIMSPGLVDVIVDRLNGHIIKFRHWTPSRTAYKEYEPKQVIHIKNYNATNPHRGQSPLIAAALEVSSNTRIAEYQNNLLSNNLRPSGVFILKDAQMGFDQAKEFREDLMPEMIGVANAGLPLVLEGDIDWKQMSLNPTDVDFINGSKLTSRGISLALGVAPELLGDSQAKTYSNVKEAKLALYSEAVIPKMMLFADEFTRIFKPDLGTMFLGYDASQVYALYEAEASMWKRTLDAKIAGVLTANEARETLGYPQKTDQPDANELKASNVGNGKENNNDEPDNGTRESQEKTLADLFRNH